MKPVLTALAIAFATTSTASFAQPTGTMYGAPQPAQKPSDQQQAPATQTTAIQPSNKARQAIANLQTAVNANDVANIPARLAAAQAVAATACAAASRAGMLATSFAFTAVWRFAMAWRALLDGWIALVWVAGACCCSDGF